MCNALLCVKKTNVALYVTHFAVIVTLCELHIHGSDEYIIMLLVNRGCHKFGFCCGLAI